MEHSLADRSEGGAPVVRTAEVFCCCIIQRGGSGDVIGGGGIKQYSLGRRGGDKRKKGQKTGFFLRDWVIISLPFRIIICFVFSQ